MRAVYSVFAKNQANIGNCSVFRLFRPSNLGALKSFTGTLEVFAGMCIQYVGSRRLMLSTGNKIVGWQH